MSKPSKTPKRKKNEKEYLLSIKLQIVNEIEKGALSVADAKRKYGIQEKATILNWLSAYGDF